MVSIMMCWSVFDHNIVISKCKTIDMSVQEKK